MKNFRIAVHMIKKKKKNEIRLNSIGVSRSIQTWGSLPSTTASVKRSFSALKRIEYFQRSTGHRDGLSSMWIISIEKKKKLIVITNR